MQKIPRPLLVLHRDPSFQERVAAVAREGGLELRLLDGWPELFEEVRAAPASALVVVDPRLGRGRRAEPSAELGRLLASFPSLAVTAVVRPTAGRAGELVALAEQGVTQVIDLDEEETERAIGQRLAAARGRPLRALVEQVLPASTGGPARAILACAATVVADGGQGADLARALSITPRTLTRWCRRALLPPPKRLLAWMRALHASALLDDPGRTISDVALSCGYAADSSLRHALGRLLGRTPSELREAGAFEVTSGRFVEALAQARSARARYRARKRR